MHCSFMAAFASGDASPINVKQRHAVSQQQKLPGINNASVQFLYVAVFLAVKGRVHAIKMW